MPVNVTLALFATPQLVVPVVLSEYPHIVGVALGAVIVGAVTLQFAACAVPLYVASLVHVHVITPVLEFFEHPLGVDNALVPLPL